MNDESSINLSFSMHDNVTFGLENGEIALMFKEPSDYREVPQFSDGQIICQVFLPLCDKIFHFLRSIFEIIDIR